VTHQELGVEPGAVMLSEILEQPDVWARLCRDPEVAHVAGTLRRRAPRVLMTVARGSSANAALYGRYLAQLRNGLVTAEVMPSVHTIHGRDVFGPECCLVAVSQSGASPDVVSAVERARAAGATTLAITNDPTSELARAAELVLAMGAGVERAVAATKSYTASVLALRLVSGALAGEDTGDRTRLAGDLAAAFERTVTGTGQLLVRWLEVFEGAASAHLVARGPNLATAKEGALKLTETSALVAQGWSAAEILHGPIASVGTGTPVLCLDDGLAQDSVASVAAAATARGAEVLPVAVPHGTALSELDAVTVGVVPLQILARELAVGRGLDPDRPQGLTKVTRTR